MVSPCVYVASTLSNAECECLRYFLRVLHGCQSCVALNTAQFDTDVVFMHFWRNLQNVLTLFTLLLCSKFPMHFRETKPYSK